MIKKNCCLKLLIYCCHIQNASKKQNAQKREKLYYSSSCCRFANPLKETFHSPKQKLHFPIALPELK